MHSMRNFLTFIKEFRIPKKKELIDARASLSKRQFKIFMLSISVAFVAMVILVGKVNSAFMTEIPAAGGSITEGIIGMPTLVNPVLALSDADKDLTSIVYSGLMRKTSDGNFILDLASSYTVSPDAMTYTFTIKKNAKFQDGTKVTADDIIFTIDKIKDPLIKSPRRIGWDGISVSKTDDSTVVFTLNQPYISFIDNTTIGILPMHVWKNVSPAEFGLSTLNIKSVGSGPYQIDSVSKNNEGIPEKYVLKRFSDFALSEAHIKYITIVSYSNEKDLIKELLSHSIDQAGGITPANAEELEKAGYVIHTATLPRIFGLFFNTANNKILSDASVMKAFDKALDREELVDKILGGYGTIAHSPIPISIIANQPTDEYKNASLAEAKDMLDKAGWLIGTDGSREKGGTTTVTRTKKVGKKTVTEKVQVNNGPVTKLSFSITTGDTPELKEAANLIKEQLEKLGGVNIEVKVYEGGPLNQLIRSRNYEALFFGQIINHESDLFSFWHSSQKTDPGLNISMYSNKNVDDILQFAQKTLDRDSRINKYNDFVTQFNKDIPALLVYSPKYLYATLPTLNNLTLNILTAPSDRFLSIHDWYAQTDHVWKIFTK
jgi:peptide/nickel transport system substrate-binding protein